MMRLVALTLTQQQTDQQIMLCMINKEIKIYMEIMLGMINIEISFFMAFLELEKHTLQSI